MRSEVEALRAALANIGLQGQKSLGKKTQNRGGAGESPIPEIFIQIGIVFVCLVLLIQVRTCVFQGGPSETPAKEYKPWARLRVTTSNQKGKTPMHLNFMKHVP